jgi:GNAT superfamily N-acetyltransferase
MEAARSPKKGVRRKLEIYDCFMVEYICTGKRILFMHITGTLSIETHYNMIDNYLIWYTGELCLNANTAACGNIDQRNMEERNTVFIGPTEGRENMIIREAQGEDLNGLLKLYTGLHDNPMPERDGRIGSIWKDILADKNHHIVLGTVEGRIVSSCVCIIILNLTHGQRPYALIENVITEEGCRKKGYGAAVLNFARDIAREAGCYKIMLLTGSKDPSILRFYEQAGYNREDKTGFIQWL